MSERAHMLQLADWRPKSIQCNAASSSQQYAERKSMHTYAITVFKVPRPDRSHGASNLLEGQPSFNSGRKGEGECRQCCAAKVANLGQYKFCSGILDLGNINANGRALAQSFKRDTGSGRDGPTRAAGSSDRRGAMDQCRLA
jgi:hypothetical protein